MVLLKNMISYFLKKMCVDCIIDKIFKNVEIVKFMHYPSNKKHLKLSKKFGCEVLQNVEIMIL